MSIGEEGAIPLFAADWALTEIDGWRGAPTSALRAGSEWSWRGGAFRLDHGPDPARSPLRLGEAIGRAELRRSAAQRSTRLWTGQAAPARAPRRAGSPLLDQGLFRAGFVVSDGRRGWPVCPTPGRSGGGFGAEQLVLFCGDVPPAEETLWVVSLATTVRRAGPGLPRVAGFAPGSTVETPFCPVPVERLRPGDPVLTDYGSTPVRRVRVRPSVAALSLAPGALGEDGPPEPVTVGAGTWLGFEGAALGALFAAGDGSTDGLDEALVYAGDLETLPGVGAVRKADLIAIEVDPGPSGTALLMVGGLACLGGAAGRSNLRALTSAEAQVALAPQTGRFAPRGARRRVA
ncbi:MAG: hypothetical protein AAF646_07580 [Pseudomonadota bacterium]